MIKSLKEFRLRFASYFLMSSIVIAIGSCILPSPPRFGYFPCIEYSNAQGEDLLNLATPGHYIADSILVSLYANGGMRTNPGQIIPPEAGHPNYYLKIDQTAANTVYIHLSKTDVDTLIYMNSPSDLKVLHYNKMLIVPKGHGSVIVSVKK